MKRIYKTYEEINQFDLANKQTNKQTNTHSRSSV